MKKMNKKGFTLVEMLVVIAIIAILVAILIPTVLGATRKAKAATDAANLRSALAEFQINYLAGTVSVGDDGEFTKVEEADGTGTVWYKTVPASKLSGLTILCIFVNSSNDFDACYSSAAPTEVPSNFSEKGNENIAKLAQIAGT